MSEPFLDLLDVRNLSYNASGSLGVGTTSVAARIGMGGGELCSVCHRLLTLSFAGLADRRSVHHRRSPIPTAAAGLDLRRARLPCPCPTNPPATCSKSSAAARSGLDRLDDRPRHRRLGRIVEDTTSSRRSSTACCTTPPSCRSTAAVTACAPTATPSTRSACPQYDDHRWELS